MLIRAVERNELPALLALYRHLHPTDPVVEPSPDIDRLWEEICSNPALHYLAAGVDGALVSTCTLTVIPNLTRGARPYGVIENVVTHPEFRHQGIGSAILRHARDLAWRQGCYKVMLLTGRKDEATLRFYEKAGFFSGVKTGFVAMRPE